MQTTSKIFVSCLCCLVLFVVSGCGGGAPKLTPAEQADVDRIIAEHGRDALLFYLQDLYMQSRNNSDEDIILKYLKHFVSKGANVNAKGIDNITSLHFAAGFANVEVVKFLVASGAEINAKTEGGRMFVSNCTPLDDARYSGHNTVVKYLESLGAKSGKDL